MKPAEKALAFLGEQRLYQIVARRLARMIEEHRDDPDWRMPGERDLAEMLEVGRPVIREAVVALEVRGLVEVKGRSGIVVLRPQTEMPGGGAPISGAGEDVFDLLGARRAFEPGLATAAAQHDADFDFELLRACIERMAGGDAATVCDAARQFQAGLARLTGNPVLTAMSEDLQAAWSGSSIVARLRDDLFGSPRAPLWAGDHHAVLTALQMRQAEAAARLAARHIDNLRSEIDDIMKKWSLDQSGGAAETGEGDDDRIGRIDPAGIGRS